MRKILTVLLTGVMLLCIAGCNTQSENEKIIEEPNHDIAGGWNDLENSGEETEKYLRSILESADKDGEYVYIEAIGVQVVAGKNYKFRCSKTNNDGYYYIVTVYVNLQNECEIISAEREQEVELISY